LIQQAFAIELQSLIHGMLHYNPYQRSNAMPISNYFVV